MSSSVFICFNAVSLEPLYPPRDMVTASGGYEDCIGMLADELADLVDEPFVRLVIRMKRGRRRQRISRRAYMPRG
jgi:hypothetical protein